MYEQHLTIATLPSAPHQAVLAMPTRTTFDHSPTKLRLITATVSLGFPTLAILAFMNSQYGCEIIFTLVPLTVHLVVAFYCWLANDEYNQELELGNPAGKPQILYGCELLRVNPNHVRRLQRTMQELEVIHIWTGYAAIAFCAIGIVFTVLTW